MCHVVHSVWLGMYYGMVVCGSMSGLCIVTGKHTELVMIATDMGLINKGGAWYTLDFVTDEELKFQGAEKVRQYLVDNPNRYEELYTAVKSTVGIKA